MHRVIIMAVLDQISQDLLRKFAIHDTVYCHHITLAYRPTEEQYPKYKALLGVPFTAKVCWVVQNSQCCAARVEPGLPSLNKHLHVTISCAPGIKPVYSNQLLDLPATEVLEMPLLHPLIINGTIIEEQI